MDCLNGLVVFMIGNDIASHVQVEYIYQIAVKQLYNLALYSVGDRRLAEKTMVGAFSDAFNRLRNKSDVALFERHCLRLLYVHGKKVQRKSEYYIGCIAQDSITEKLIGLNFEERYVLLLFCWRKQSIKQIAQTTRLPQFMIEQRLNAAVRKAARWTA